MSSAKRGPPSTPLSSDVNSQVRYSMRSWINDTSQALANNTHNNAHNSQPHEGNNLGTNFHDRANAILGTSRNYASNSNWVKIVEDTSVSNSHFRSENTLETNRSPVSNSIQNATLASDDTVELLNSSLMNNSYFLEQIL